MQLLWSGRPLPLNNESHLHTHIISVVKLQDNRGSKLVPQIRPMTGQKEKQKDLIMRPVMKYKAASLLQFGVSPWDVPVAVPGEG
jgi:hypothetical protein